MSKRPTPKRVLDDEMADPALLFFQDKPAASAEPAAEPAVRPVDAPRPRAGSQGMPKHRQAVRGESRLWPEQKDALARIKRAVSAQRTVRTESITENTLVRLAVDVLIDNADLLVGNTEDELRAAIRTGLQQARKAHTQNQ